VHIRCYPYGAGIYGIGLIGEIIVRMRASPYAVRARGATSQSDDAFVTTFFAATAASAGK